MWSNRVIGKILCVWSLMAIFLCCGEGIASGQNNLVVNPGFETVIEIEGKLVPKNWGREYQYYERSKGSGLSQISVNNVLAHSGRYCLEVLGNNNRGIAMQTITKNIFPDTQYKVSGWARTQELKGGICFSVDYYTTTPEIKYLGKGIIGNITNETSGWVYLEEVVTTSPKTDKVYLAIGTRAPNTGIVWFASLSARL